MKPDEFTSASTARQHEDYRALLELLPRGVRHEPPHPAYFTGYEYGTLYDWDQYFESVALGYCGYASSYARNGIDIFLGQQSADGFIPRSFLPGTGVYRKHQAMFKPFIAQIALVLVHRGEGVAWLEEDGRYEKMGRFFSCWTSRFDVRGDGLAVWLDAGHTGMDNHYDRAGGWEGPNGFCEGVDLNAYLVREGEALAILAGLLGRPGEAAAWRARAERVRQAMRRHLWDEADGFFYDRDARSGRRIPIRHVGAFATLWARVAEPVQARRLVEEHLTNPRRFWRPYPLPALAADEPGYAEGFLPGESTGCCNWRANTWVPANYFTIHGLRYYGYDVLALELAERTFGLFQRGRFSEYYTSESGIGTGLKPFWGWSCLALFLPTECRLGLDPTALTAANPAIDEIRRLFADATKRG